MYVLRVVNCSLYLSVYTCPVYVISPAYSLYFDHVFQMNIWIQSNSLLTIKLPDLSVFNVVLNSSLNCTVIVTIHVLVQLVPWPSTYDHTDLGRMTLVIVGGRRELQFETHTPAVLEMARNIIIDSVDYFFELVCNSCQSNYDLTMLVYIGSKYFTTIHNILQDGQAEIRKRCWVELWWYFSVFTWG